MGLFEKLFGKEAAPVGVPEGKFKTLTAYEPMFRHWSGSIYESELARAAIDAKARHASKLQVTVSGAAKPVLQSKLRSAPNAFQTWGQFLYRVSTILDVENTAFIAPVLGEYGETTGYYPLCPKRWELVQYNGEPWLRFEFNDNKRAAIELSRVGIMTRFQYRSDFFGESNAALDPTMELIQIQNQGIAEGVKSAATYRFMAKLNNIAKPDDLKKERELFSEKNLREGRGVLLFPYTWNDIKQIESKPFVVDADQMATIENNVFNYFGVNEAVLQSKADADELDAFFNGTIEPFAIQLSEVLTKMTFTLRERSFGAEVRVTSNRLQYMSIANKIALVKDMGDRGMITIDEARELLNYAPLPDGAGTMAPIRGEYYNAATTEEVTENASEA